VYSEAWNKDTLLDTCLLVDGYSLAFRAFYALPQTLTNSSGQPTNALHGFSKMLATLIERYRPDYLAVALDFPAPTFRDELLATYKGQRPTTPEALKAQLEILRPLIASLGVKVVEQQGYEADDVVATLATLARDRAIKSFIVTG
jgi:DNA polymerase-1